MSESMVITLNLYQLTDQYQQLLDFLQSVDTNDRENQQIFKDTLDSITDAIDVKAEGYAMVINQMKADLKMLKEERNRYEIRINALTNNINRMNNALFEAMKLTNKEKIKSPRFSIWIQNNPPSLEVLDELAIPSKYYVEQLPKLDRRNLLADLKAGQQIDGATIKQTEGVRIK